MQKAKILIVEDEHIVAKDIASILEGFGYTVTAMVGTGKLALASVKENPPDLVLMDIRLRGDMDGIATAHSIQMLRDIPIIYLTAHADEATIQRAKITGPLAYLLKPFNEQDLRIAIDIGIYRHRIESENKKLAEQVVRLSRKVPLTSNEKKVLYGLVRYPLLNDIQLERKLKIKRSTITAIRNRLQGDGYYRTYQIPNFGMLGCELAVYIEGDVNPTVGTQKQDVLRSVANEESMVFFMATKLEFFGLMVADSFSSFNARFEHLRRLCRDEGISKNVQATYFPCKSLSVIKLFDFSGYLNHLFGLGEQLPAPKPFPTKGRKLSAKEKEVLLALVRHPEMHDTDIARIAKLPRTTVSQLRKRLIQEQFLITVNVPDLVKLRSEILVVDRKQIQHQTDSVVSYLAGLGSNIFLLSNDRTLLSMSTYADYTAYEEMLTQKADTYATQEVQIEQQVSHIVPLPLVTLQRIDFASLAQRLMGLKAV